MSARRREPGKSVTSRVVEILGAFDEVHTGLTLTDVARRSGLPLSTTHRLVHELEDTGLLTRDSVGGFHIGLRLWELGQLANSRLREVAHPWLQELFDSTRENVQLGVRDGFEVLYLDKVYGRRAVPIISRVGGRLPMHTTGVGKALLAFQPTWFLQSYLARKLERPTPFAITEPGRLSRELAITRNRGWAITKEEMTLGSCSLAAPIRDAEGKVIASIGVVLASRRAGELDGLVQPVLSTAAEVGRAYAASGDARHLVTT